MGKQERVDIAFRFQALSTTPNGILMKFLKEHKATGFSHEMLLKAARAFWLAEAYQACGAKKGSELKKLAQTMIFALEDQADYLRTMFDLERPPHGFGQIPVYATSPSNRVQELEDVEQEESIWDSVPQLDTGGL